MPEITDQKVRETALDLSRSFIVQAPAGSGKTELLIQRFLNLLSKVEQPEQIVCMTFTRKAAGEMRDRIFKALTVASSGEPPDQPHLQTSWKLATQVLEHDKARGWNLLHNPGRLKIQTIDSFCFWITSHMPLKSRLGSSLKPEEFSLSAYREAAKNMLARVEEDSATGRCAKTLLRHLDNNKLDFLKRIQFLLEKRDQWMIPFFSSFETTPLHKKWFESALQDMLQEKLMAINAIFPASVKSQLPSLLAFSAENKNQETDDLSPLTGITEFPKPVHENVSQWRELATLLVTDAGTFRKQITKSQGFPTTDKEKKNAFKEILDSISENSSLAYALKEARNFPDPVFSDEDWAILEATFGILEPLENSLREVFRKREVTDFTEVSLAAIHALGEYDRDENLLPTDLAEYLDYKIQHILVDEYQDTSFKQYELLKRLTAGWQPDDGRTLFIVGDPMQSIFRFRDAEVGIFLRTQNEGIGDLQPDKLTLTTNFRSQKGLVNWVNDCFNSVFPKKENPDLGEIRYTPSQAFHAGMGFPGVEYHPYNSPQHEIEAKDIADLIQRLQNEHPDKDIAILGRAKRHLQNIIRELRHRGIEYSAEDIDPLSERWEILDLLSLLQALLKPMDRIAWLSILRAPWVGLSMADIHSLCKDSQGSSIWSLLVNQERLAALSDDGRTRAENMVSVFKPALAGFTTGRLRDTIEALWIKLGGPASIAETSRRDCETFFDELEKVLDSGEEFDLDNFKNRLDNIYSTASSSGCSLQLITMHKAKGLEFDFVILPGLGRSPRSEKNRLVFWLPHKNSLLLAPIEETGTESSPLYQYVKNINAKKDSSESARLLYVAATRAKCQLHLFGHVKERKEGLSPENSSSLSILWPYLEQHWTTNQEAVENKTELEQRPLYPNALRRFKSRFFLPEPCEALPTGREINLKETEEPLFEWAGRRARSLGTVIHQCLQSLAETGFDSDPDKEIKKWESRINTTFMGTGLTGHDLKWANEQCQQALLNTLNDEKGCWVLSPHEDAKNEFALTFTKEGTIETRILDRTFVENGIRWIIDYKSGIHEGGDLEAFLKNEVDRHRPQLEAYEKALRKFGETRPVKKAIYHPLYQRLLEV